MRKGLGFFAFVFVACTLFACHENQFNPNENLTRESYSQLSVDRYRISISHVNEQIAKMLKGDNDTLTADRHVRSYYLSGGSLLWVKRWGVTSQADTLLRYLKTVEDIGFSKSRFFVSQIEDDLKKMKSLDVADCDINELAVRLDYNLTKAYLRYVIGQRYGFVNPFKVLNRLDLDPYDTLKQNYRRLYDVHTETARGKEVAHLLGLIACDSVAEMLKTAEATTPLYRKLKSLLPTATGAERMKLLVNMERCRWRQARYPFECEKYVLVNIPSYGLMAVKGNDVLRMKVVCGSRRTKTPLLDSDITHMDINPKWAIPFNIIKHEMSRHAGDAEYFERNNYVITEKSTGDVVAPENLSAEDLKSGNYRVAQTGGEGNSLGRIIFRFNNNFSIFLHDTSSRGTFDRADRSASHGCVRVEKPYELACFLLGDKNTEVLDKLKYSMQVSTRMSVDEEGNVSTSAIDKSRLLHSLKVTPSVPIFISYFTKWLMPDGHLESYDDVYGYDGVIAARLKPYVRQ